MSTKSAKTTAAQRAQHFRRRFEPLPLKHCILEDRADYAFRNEESQKQKPQKLKALAVGLTVSFGYATGFKCLSSATFQ